MNAADIMTPDVITVGPDTPLDQVVTLMLDGRISGIPVVDEDAVVGIVTEGDLLRRVELGSEPAGRTCWNWSPVPRRWPPSMCAATGARRPRS